MNRKALKNELLSSMRHHEQPDHRYLVKLDEEDDDHHAPDQHLTQVGQSRK